MRLYAQIWHYFFFIEQIQCRSVRPATLLCSQILPRSLARDRLFAVSCLSYVPPFDSAVFPSSALLDWPCSGLSYSNQRNAIVRTQLPRHLFVSVVPAVAYYTDSLSNLHRTQSLCPVDFDSRTPSFVPMLPPLFSSLFRLYPIRLSSFRHRSAYQNASFRRMSSCQEEPEESKPCDNSVAGPSVDSYCTFHYQSPIGYHKRFVSICPTECHTLRSKL